MIKDVWINFPSKNLAKTKEFLEKIGFELDEKSNDQMVGFKIGAKQTAVMFFPEETLKSFMKNEISDTKTGSEMMISFDAESADEVDETARRVFDAGGTIIAEPAEIQGWMYGLAFSDPDGHRWNQLFMDFSKMPQG